MHGIKLNVGTFNIPHKFKKCNYYFLKKGEKMDWIDECITKARRNGITQKMIAEKSGISEHTISKIFSRKCSARSDNQRKIESAIEQLIKGK